MKFRKYTGANLFGLLKAAIDQTRSGDLSLAQSIMSANAPMIIQKAMVDGEPDQGVLPSGQVAGTITELLSCEQIINGIVAEAEARLTMLAERVDGGSAA